ncbi:hypothetical protein F5X68DRAFT_258054 [Plectosphaerella plurivora]|uniref:Uncharacterized protein n=1 Tax=Plectosphaerella plurivora TaxID=936078 RepID=A0A9P8VMH7_9PEZI|nr:hypothetical protein F5X68DRAFT_258054 [Plectosphaerella plurivora]
MPDATSTPGKTSEKNGACSTAAEVPVTAAAPAAESPSDPALPGESSAAREARLAAQARLLAEINAAPVEGSAHEGPTTTRATPESDAAREAARRAARERFHARLNAPVEGPVRIIDMKTFGTPTKWIIREGVSSIVTYSEIITQIMGRRDLIIQSNMGPPGYGPGSGPCSMNNRVMFIVVDITEDAVLQTFYKANECVVELEDGMKTVRLLETGAKGKETERLINEKLELGPDGVRDTGGTPTRKPNTAKAKPSPATERRKMGMSAKECEEAVPEFKHYDKLYENESTDDDMTVGESCDSVGAADGTHVTEGGETAETAQVWDEMDEEPMMVKKARKEDARARRNNPSTEESTVDEFTDDDDTIDAPTTKTKRPSTDKPSADKSESNEKSTAEKPSTDKSSTDESKSNKKSAVATDRPRVVAVKSLRIVNTSKGDEPTTPKSTASKPGENITNRPKTVTPKADKGKGKAKANEVENYQTDVDEEEAEEIEWDVAPKTPTPKKHAINYKKAKKAKRKNRR